jgi:nitroreductase
MPTLKTKHIKSRRSVRRYRPDPVPLQVIRDILDCGHLAPSGHNRQPWLLGAVTDPILLGRLADLVENARFLQQSTVCFPVFTKLDETFYLEDGCAAAMNIIHACAAHGVATCWIAGAKQGYAEEVRELLVIPGEYSLVTLIAAGYPDQTPGSSKRPLDEVTFMNRYARSDGED